MGILDVVKDVGSGIVKGVTGGLVDLGGKAAEDALIGDPNSAKAYKRQKDFYKHRYTWMMKDMRKAGLNPILAAGSSGFSTSGVPAVSQTHLPTSSFSASAKNLAEIGLLEEQTTHETVKQLKTMAEARTEIEKKYTERARAGELQAHEKEHLARFQNLWQDIHKMRDQQGVLKIEKEVAEAKLKEVTYHLNQLKNISEVYAAPASKILTILNEITRSLGLSGHAGAGFMKVAK